MGRSLGIGIGIGMRGTSKKNWGITPDTPTVTINNNTSLTVDWVITGLDKTVTAVELWHSTDGTTYTRLVKLWAVATYDHTGLENNSIHYYKVRYWSGVYVSGFSGVISGTTMDFDSLSFHVIGRNNLVLEDTIGSDDVNILTPCILSSSDTFAAGNASRAAEKLFDGGSYTIYFKAKQVSAIANCYPLKFGNAGGNTQRGMSMFTVSQNLYFKVSDGSAYQEAVQLGNIDTTLLPLDYFEVFIEINTTDNTAKCKVYNPSGEIVGNSVSKSIAAFTFNNDDNYAPLRFNSLGKFATAEFKKFSGIKTLAQCQDKAYFTDLQLYYPHIIDGCDVSGNANHLTGTNVTLYMSYKYYSNLSSYYLDRGFSEYQQLPNTHKITVPHDINGGAITRTFTGYEKTKDVAGNASYHNLSDSYLEFTGDSSANWDKSNRTIIGAIIEALHYSPISNFNYYNATYPKRWHISELVRVIMSNAYNDNYKALSFSKVINNSFSDKQYLKELFGYETDKATLISTILNYCGDSETINNNIKFTIDITDSHEQTLYLKGIIGAEKVVVYWGDGGVSEMLMDGTIEEVTHNYVADGTYNVQIQNPASLIELDLSYKEYNGDLSIFDTAVNLEKINLSFSGFRSGSISGWSSKLKELKLWETDKGEGTTEASGSMDHMKDLEVLLLGGKNTVTGTIDDKIKLIQVYISGYSTISGDASACVNMEQFETSMAYLGWSMKPYITVAHMENWTKIHIICTDVNMAGDITTSGAQFGYFSYTGDWLLTANISNWTRLYELIGGSNNVEFTGSFDNLTKLQTYHGGGKYITKPTRLINNPKIVDFVACSTWVWTSEEINQLLADMWTNRNDDKTNEDGFTKPNRIFNVATIGSGAPTGQGLTDKANLEAYSSPTPPGTAALWTVTTN